ncbi:MAG: hypothetical protein C0631_15040 [Sedimenticola sp.]|jgi:polyhydroxyalkanoate synthesis regulator phasin|nr:MAG: hypothetical protein C0631_15040 [Sedimenticola sp.]
MKKTITISLAALIGFILVQPVSAEGYGRGIERMADQQHQQIRQGVKRGDLTKSEARALKNQQRRIASLKREFREDGWLSKKERRILRERYQRADHRIDRLRNNDESRRHRSTSHHRHGGDHTRHYDKGPRFGFWYRDDGWYVQRKW